ncbi:MAG: serpin family protein [Bacteroidales bacterium]|nr:serpin family protein [Bacteroidales bacterium]
MKSRLFLLPLVILAVACAEKPTTDDLVTEPEDAFAVTAPTPTEAVAHLRLDEAQEGYVRAGHEKSFRLLKQLARETATSYVCSPLSLQVAMAMLANGAEGETRAEILSALGYGQEDVEELNRFVRSLILQLPALDLDVTLRLADALLVTDRYPIRSTFRTAIRDSYFAPATTVPFNDPQYVLDLVNGWADRNTDGLIKPMLEEIDPNTVAILLNALYFKARWQEVDGAVIFDPDATAEDVFHRSAGTETKVSYMTTVKRFRYADKGSYEVLSIPYSNGQFCLYVLLPKRFQDFYPMLDELIATPWEEVIPRADAFKRVDLRLPKFDSAGDFNLNIALGSLGVRRIFDDSLAQFGPMFEVNRSGFYVSQVLQKAKISLAEWGTEAAAVTSVEVTEKSAPQPEVTFHADHPFVYVIAGSDADTPILFGGVFAGV